MNTQDRPILAPAPRTDDIQIAGRDPIPVTLLTGFLGSGKTTLLNRILSGSHGLRVGVLVNDFGAINIDAELVEGVEENTINLSNGCICCEIRDDLVQSLEELLLRAEQIDYVIVEASGVSDPEGIVMTFLDRRYEKLLYLDSITCIVDAEAIFAQSEDEQLNALKLRQIGFADMIILNKVDLVGPKHIEVVHEWIDHHFNRVRIIEAINCEVPYEILLSVGRFDPALATQEQTLDEIGGCEGAQCTNPTHDHHAGHRHDLAGDIFQTWSFVTDAPMSAARLNEIVKRKLPSSVFRCKGIFWSSDAPDMRQSLQAVGRRSKIKPIGSWGVRPRKTQIVAIGRDIPVDTLEELFGSMVENEVVR